MSQFTDRILGAAKLDAAVYEAVGRDETATGQAAAVVVLSALAAGIGTIAQAGFFALIMTTIGALIGWLAWAAIIWFVGTRLLPRPQTHANLGQLMRAMGFAMAPGLLRIFEIIPGLGGLIFLIISIWMLVTMVIAVRQSLSFNSNGRAVAVVIVGWLIQWLIIWLLAGPAIFGLAPAPPPALPPA